MKIYRSILTIIVIGFFGFAANIIAFLSRAAPFYTILIPAFTIGLIIITILAIYQKLKHPLLKSSTIVFFALCVLSVITFEGYQAYQKSLEVGSTQDVDLSEYRPFLKNTKAVSLDETSSFKISDNLPLLDGATALYPVYSAFAQAVYPEKEYPLYEGEVVSRQTRHAFNRLLKGQADIIFIAQPSRRQMEFAKQQGLDLTLTPIGREAFVFFVHADNPVEELSIKQIQGIYSGKITNWSEVGGEDEEIRAFQRPEGSGSQSALIKLMDNISLMNPPSEDVVSGMGGIISETMNYKNRKNAIGFSFRHFSQNMVENGKIKNIAVEGILPTKENIQNETYPIADQFYAITAGSENPHIKAFIEWMQSPQGQEIINKTGYVPIK